MSDLVAELPCGADYPITTAFAISISFVGGSITLFVCIVTFARLRKDKSFSLKDNGPRVRSLYILHYVQLTFLLLCGAFSPAHTILSTVQCYPSFFAVSRVLVNVMYWCTNLVCFMLSENRLHSTRSVS